MIKIKSKSKGFYIIFGFIDAVLLLAAVFLLAVSVMFNGGGAPSVFGHNIFIVETDAFSLVEKGSALITSEVPYSEITAGNIVIFTDEDDGPLIGEIQSVSGEDGIYTFDVKDDAGNSLTIGQSRIVGKGMYYSPTIGKIVSFAVSPAGVCLIAILPCSAIIIFEIISAIRRKTPQPEVKTVKKQEETPTYVPRGGYVGDELDITVGDAPAFRSPSDSRQKKVEAAGLLTQPSKIAEQKRTQTARGQAPVTEREIDRLIRETKAKYANDPLFKNEDSGTEKPQTRASSKTAAKRSSTVPVFSPEPVIHKPKPEPEPVSKPEPFVFEEEPVKSYVPKASSMQKHAPRVSRLDSLLQEEEASDANYDIDDILNSIEHKQ